jgi:SecD/SecF fusion protein
MKWKAILVLGVIAVSLYYVYANFRWYSLPGEKREIAELVVRKEAGRALSEVEREKIAELTEQEKAHYHRLGLLRGEVLNLGLDLQGGAHLVLEVDTDKTLEIEIARHVETLKRELRHIEGIRLLQDKKIVNISFTHEDDYQAIRDIVDENIWDLVRASPTKIVLTFSDWQATTIKRTAVDGTLGRIRRRVDEFGVAEPLIQPQGERRIIVQLPGMRDPERAKEIIRRTAFLEFKLAAPVGLISEVISDIRATLAVKNEEISFPVHHRQELTDIGAPFDMVSFSEDDFALINSVLQKEEILALIPEGYSFAMTHPLGEGERRFRNLYLLEEGPVLTGDLLENAFPSFDEFHRRVIQLEFNRHGGAIMSRISRHAERAYNEEREVTILAILLDDVIYSAPFMKVRVGARPIITGDFTREEAMDLSLVLREGALPAPISTEMEMIIGASLGADSIHAGVRAGIIGLIGIAFLMGIYYLKAGLIATFALSLNFIIILAVLSMLGATLTLPGIAGIILVIGMAVDANILIFERIREEVKSGKAIRSAISAGYQRAFLTILDANLTTLIVAVVLFWFGTGPIRGFATTLSIGIISSMFTAIVVTRLILDLMASRKSFAALKMLQIVDVPRIRFIRHRRKAFTLSALVLFAGMIIFFARGERNFGIDLSPGGGVLLERHFTSPVYAGDIREALIGVGAEGARIQQFSDNKGVLIRIGKGEDYEVTVQAIDAQLNEKFHGLFIDDEEFKRTDVIGPVMGREMQRSGVFALIFALILVVTYIAWRFEFKFGIAAVVALIHDVLVTVGILSILRIEFDLAIIAALLTIVGYSINDTIVTFDRIRENLKSMHGKSYAEIINVSINQTLSRTLLTSLTTLIPMVSLFVLGGIAISGFAITLIIGILFGTFSSIFIAAPILVEWQMPRLKAA